MSLADLTTNFTLDEAANFNYAASPGGIEISAVSQTATANTPHPQSPYPPRVQIDFLADAIGGQVRVILGGSICIQVTIEAGTASLDIIDLSDDSELCETVTCSGVVVDEWYRLTVCYDPDTGVAKGELADAATGTARCSACAVYNNSLPIGSYAAFGTGPDHVSNMFVRRFRYWRLWYCGPPPYTTDCSTDDYYYDIPARKYCFTCEIPLCETCKLEGRTPASATVQTGSFGSGTLCSRIGGLYYISGCSPCDISETFRFSIGISTFAVTVTVYLQAGYTQIFQQCPGFPLHVLDPNVHLIVLLQYGDGISFSVTHLWSLELTQHPKRVAADFFVGDDIGDRAGTFNGQDYYELYPNHNTWYWGTDPFYLFYDTGGSQWCISRELGVLNEPYWTSPTNIGVYTGTFGGVEVYAGVFCNELEDSYTVPYVGACTIAGLGIYSGDAFCTYDGSAAIVDF